MTSLTRQLYLFLAACGGNWRNTIFVTSRREPSYPGYLLAADHDGGRPVIIKADFHYMTGVWIEPGAEQTISLDRQRKIQIGNCYRAYFRKSAKYSFFPSIISTYTTRYRINFIKYIILY